MTRTSVTLTLHGPTVLTRLEDGSVYINGEQLFAPFIEGRPCTSCGGTGHQRRERPR